MKKILLVAGREFLATAGTRAFILTTLITPAMIALLIFLVPRMINEAPPDVQGEVAIVDPTGQVADGLRAFLQPDRIAARREEEYRRFQDNMPSALRSATPTMRPGSPGADALESVLGNVPRLTVVTLDPAEDLEAAKTPLTREPPAGGSTSTRLALIVVHRDAVARADGAERFGSYDFFIRAKLDDRLIDEISGGIRESIVDARLRTSGLDRRAIDALTRVDRVASRTVTTAGEEGTNRVLNMVMPAAFMGLLLISVMLSGQYLLTTTVEEKANRVVEVLLSAVSPMELMAGKILGQMAVGLLVLTLYAGLGIMALLAFASFGLIDPMLIVFLLVFYLLAYLSMGAIMAAVGSAVNEMREAQGLMTPIMLLVMIPWILWMPISRDPNSVFATVLSFIPPISNFVMMLRLASATPPPLWQAFLAIVVGAVGGYASLWIAAKVFRIGLLMYGKPPTFATLVRWARMG
jgi:ABC-2 type transport system permease protein